MLLSILIPTYNEEKTILKLLQLINYQKKKINLEILICDDGSNDFTHEILVKNKAMYDVLITNKKNMGKGNAIKNLIKIAKGEIILIQDADLEYNPEDYLSLIEPIILKKCNVVYGSRVLGKPSRYKNNKFTSMFRVLGNHLLTIISNKINNQNLTDAHTCYKVFNKDIFKKLSLEHDDFSFCPEITTKIAKLGEKILEVPISYSGRGFHEGKKIGYRDFFIAIYSLIKFKLKK